MRHRELDNSQQGAVAAAIGVCAKRSTPRRKWSVAGFLALILLVSGCAEMEAIWNRPLFWGTQPPPVYEDPTPYRNWASEIDYPEVMASDPSPELYIAEPRRLRNLQKDEIWDMPLEQALQIALSNSHVIRSAGQFLSPANPLLNSPDFVPSSLDPAIQESGVLFGQRGVEAALSEFDTQFTTSMVWGRDEQIQNSAFGTGVDPGSTLTQETGNFSMALTKRLAHGGVIGVIHDWNYRGSNANEVSEFSDPLLFPSTYTGRVRLEARQPLWAGAGTEYTRIAGPISEQIQGVTGVQQGVVIARINNDIELTEFEGAIRDLLHDVETLYWQLYLAYQVYAEETSLLAEAVESYQRVEALVASDSPYAGTLEKTDALEFVYQVQSRVDFARNNLYDMEAQLRRIIGLPVNDGSVIRPLDEPTLAEFVPDWYTTLSEALARRVELRKHKWNIRQLELQLRAAEQLVKPRLDFVAAYQVNGFGDDLLGSTSDGVTTQGLGNAAATITRGDQTSWNLGFELSLPLGMRFAHAQVRNLEFKLAKARAMLEAAETEVSHELADTFRELDRAYLALQQNYNRKRNAAERLKAIEAKHLNEPERYTEDAILRARDNLAQIEQTYLQSLIEYNVAVLELHYRAGKLLEMNNVHLSEGPWDAEAEVDVLDRGYDRWHSLPTRTMMHTAPEPFVFHEPMLPAEPPADAYGPAKEGWIIDAPWGVERSEEPGWDLQEPALIPGPQHPAPGGDVPEQGAPDDRRPDEGGKPPNGGPNRSTVYDPVDPPLVSGVPELGSANRAAADFPAAQEEIWDLGATADSRSNEGPIESPTPSRGDHSILNTDKLKAQILRASAQARGYPTSSRDEERNRWRSEDTEPLRHADHEWEAMTGP